MGLFDIFKKSESVLPQQSKPVTINPTSISHTYKRGDIIGNKYQVFDVLGKGGCGVVYLVYAKETKSVYALKTYKEEYLSNSHAIELFKKEAYLWLSIDQHPHIVKAHFVDNHAGRYYICMDFIAPDELGLNSLDRILSKRKPDLKQSLIWAIQFCHGIQFAYSKGIKSHRDIKPANIMIDNNNMLKISDFGLAGVTNADQFGKTAINTGSTIIGSSFGTPTHMPPEQFDDASSCDHRSDIYSFGVVLYEMATGGCLPFKTDNTQHFWQVFKHLHCNQEVPQINSPLFPVIQRCMHKDPQNRFQSFDSLKRELETLLHNQFGINSTPVSSEKMNVADYMNKAASFEILGMCDEALKISIKSTEVAPDYPLAWNNRGACHASNGDIKNAISCWNKAIALDKETSRAWYNLGNYLMSTGKPDEALKHFSNSVRIEPSYVPAWNNMAMVYEKTGRLNDAVHCYDKAIEYDPNATMVWHNKGFLLYQCDRLPDALECFNRAVQIDPNYVSAWNYLGLCYGNMGNAVEAFKCFDNALNINPGYVHAKRNKEAFLAHFKKQAY